MKVTVCEFAQSPDDDPAVWRALVAHAKAERSYLVLLPEMPFYRWLAATKDVDQDAWQLAVDAHERWLGRLAELGAPLVISTRPVMREGQNLNQGYIWDQNAGSRDVHHKYYLPDEEGYWEATWYRRGSGHDFDVVDTNAGKTGFMICTELWFFQHARAYAAQGIEILAVPRATPTSTIDKWIAGGRAAAVVSGAYCLSSNFGGVGGWIIGPEEGDVLGVTTPQRPFLTLEIDLAAARRAKSSYPRYVLE